MAQASSLCGQWTSSPQISQKNTAESHRPAMLDSFLQFLNFLPAGLLIAAVCLEGFVVSRRDRGSEPAVLWLLFCTAVAASIAAITDFTLYFVRIDPGGLKSGLVAGALAAVASVAWFLKRQARNRSLLFLNELFFDPIDPKQPPRRKPWQAFLIVGYRAALGFAVLCGLAGIFLTAKNSTAGPGAAMVAVPADNSNSAAHAGAPATPAVQKQAVASSVPAMPEAPGSPSMTDPTRAELPSEDASAVAAMATSAAMGPGAGLAGSVHGAGEGAADSMGPPAADAAAVPVVAVPAAAPARPVSKNSLYFSKIRPILAKHCVSCHGTQKQKGDLRLDSPDAIRAGVNGKQVVVPGVPEKSRIYHVTGLPQDDIDRMPPKGSPLNSTERGLLAEWIKNGADLGDGVSIPAGPGGVFLVDTIAQNLPVPDEAVMADLKKDHVVVRALSQNGRVLELDFSHSDRAAGDLKLSQLGPIALNIYALDFSRTKITDADLGQLLPMKNLARLLLSRTGITDAGLAALKNNANLEHLNLYDTAITDAGLTSLSGLKSLKKVYLWQSKATPDGVRKLQEEVPGLVVSIGG